MSARYETSTTFILNADLALAERVARAAGALLLARFGEPAHGVGSKSSATDLVSDADRDAETLIRDLLLRERPEDGLLAEEGTSEAGESGRRWVFDPLDGTVSYLYGYPHWCVSVALEDTQGSAALDLAWLAAGRLDAYYERGLNAWDWAAGSLLVREAGGAVEELVGEPFGLIAGPATVVTALRPLVEA